MSSNLSSNRSGSAIKSTSGAKVNYPTFKRKNNGLLISVIIALSIALIAVSATFVVFCIGSDGQFLWEINTWLVP